MTKQEFQDFKDKLKETAVLDLEEAILTLSPYLIDREEKDVLITIKGRLRRLRNDYNRDTIKHSKYSQYLNGLIANFINSVNLLDIDDLNISISTKILVLSPNHARLNKLRYIIGNSMSDFVQVEYAEFVENQDVTGFRIVVYDNTEFPMLKDDSALEGTPETLQAQFEHMRSTLDNTECYVLHIGELNYLVSAYREQAYGANSNATIVPRLNELVEYIRLNNNYITNQQQA